MNAINPITPRTDAVTILQGDDERQLQALRDKAADLKSGEAYDAAVEAANKFAASAEKRGVTVVLRAVGRKTWRDLIAANPPRDGNEGDKALGANTEDFEEALVPVSIGSPVFESNEQRDAFLNSLSAAQFGDLAIAAWKLNMVSGADPKARLLSTPDRS